MGGSEDPAAPNIIAAYSKSLTSHNIIDSNKYLHEFVMFFAGPGAAGWGRGWVGPP